MCFTLLLCVAVAISVSAVSAQEPVGEESSPPYVALFYESDAQPSSNPFIAMARQGAAEAREEFSVDFSEYKIADGETRYDALNKVAASGVRLVITLGFRNVAPVLKIAEHFPKVQFTVIDGMVPSLRSNVQSVMFKDNEGAFLVGIVAALKSKSKKVGFIGGMDVPLIRNFAYGYEQGVHYIDPDIVVLRDMIGNSPAAWDNPARAAELAVAQFDKGVDIIFAAAGASGRGVLNAAHQNAKFAIGVDTNQNGIYPGSVLTSMVKRVDKAVYSAIRKSVQGEWKSGNKYLGISEGALDYAVDKHNRDLLSLDIINRVENTKDRIIRGMVVVEPYTAY